VLTEKMKRVKLIIARTDLENVLQVLLRLCCVEVTEPDESPVDKELENLLSRETIDLSQYNANLQSITLLGTQYTLLLSGWATARAEQELVSRLSKLICAWEIEDPSPDERDKVPLFLKWPKITGFFYKGAGKQFNPLTSVQEPI